MDIIKYERCPFCKSNKLKVESRTTNRKTYINGEFYTKETFSIRCNACHARGPTTNCLYVRKYSPEGENNINKAIEEAWRLWNDR